MMRLNIQGWLNKIKANANFSNVDNSGGNAASNLNSVGIRTVIDEWKSGYSWFRVWSDGWIEQGGNDYSATTTYPTNRTINFNKAFTQNNPTVVIGGSAVSDGAAWHSGFSSSVNPPMTKTSFSYKGCLNGNGTANGVSWYACGF